MDQLKSFIGGNNQDGEPQHEQRSEGSEHKKEGGLSDMFNNALGGGENSEVKEDKLDKAVDFVQEKFLGQGDQSNESAVEQAKDEQISDFIRGQYKERTGKEFFVADKEH